MKKKAQKQNWIVLMRCTVLKEVYVDDCTEDDARNKPWDFAVDEKETEQRDWEVIDVEPNK